MTQSQLEAQLAFQVKACGLPEPMTQYRLPELPDRRFAFDFAWPVQRLLVEVNGSTWIANSGHTSGKGIERDCEKLCLAVVNGWKVMMVTGLQVKDGRAVQWIERALNVSELMGGEPQDADI